MNKEPASPPQHKKKPTFIEPDFSAASSKTAEPAPQQPSKKPTFMEPAFALDGADEEEEGDGDQGKMRRVRAFAEPGFPGAKGEEEILSPTEHGRRDH